MLSEIRIINLEQRAWESLEVVRKVGLADKSYLDTQLINYGQRLELFDKWQVNRAQQYYREKQKNKDNNQGDSKY